MRDQDAPANPSHDLSFAALTPSRWTDFETLFGARGACAGCWCMYWCQRGKQWTERVPEANRLAMRERVRRGPPPGLIAYDGDTPIGWCQVGARDTYARIAHARAKAALDARPTWAITCFFIAKTHRGRGVMVRLIEAACAFAAEQGAARVEGFPLSSDKPTAATFAYVGTPSAFRQAGFSLVRKTIAGTATRRYVRALA